MVVVCPSCGATANTDARFCSECGGSLTHACAQCGSVLNPGAKFCSSCGSASIEAQVTGSVLTEERRIISVLFVDLVGFTAHTERSEPEDTRYRLGLYHARVRQDVERFGGRVEKLMGDGVFAVFGAPVAHEDDAERAVRSALRIIESVEQLTAENPELALAVRVGVTTGEAIVQLESSQDREGIVGDVVNTASRLQGIADPGHVVVDDRTYRATRSSVEFDNLGEVELKGKGSKPHVWRARGVRSRFGTAAEAETTGVFVGRTHELALISDTFDRAVSRRSPQLLTLVGEPGVGKSRLVGEFSRHIDDRPDLVWWRQGRCLPYGEGISFWAIGEVIKAHAGVLESEPIDAVTSKLHAAVSALFDDPVESAWVELRLGSLLGLSAAPTERTELFAAWLRFFEALAARNSLVLVIEDLHWADDAVVEFLLHLLDWATDSPILVLCTARPELFAQRPDWGGGKRDAITIGLAPLSDEETVLLMSSLAKRPLMDAVVQQSLVERSGGNPLYINEFVRLVEELGWRGKLTAGDDVPLPDSVAAIIAARLDLLDTDDKTILQAAAVVGRVFWAAALSFIEGIDAAEVQRRLRRLVTSELIRPVRRSSMQGQDEYSFAHVLARDGAYKRLTREDRARLHEATARWLEAVSGERATDVAELLAFHHAVAWELAPSLDADRRRRVYRFQMAAGERAQAFDAVRAAGFYRSAITVAGTESERGRSLLELQRLDVGTIDERHALLMEAIDAFASNDDREGQAETASALGSLEWYRGHSDDADRWGDRALELVEGLQSSPGLAKVLSAAASSKQLRGREDEAIDLVERGLSVAKEVNDTSTYARLLCIRGSAMGQLGDSSGLDDVMEALRIQLDRNYTANAIMTYNNAATMQISFGFLTDGRTLIEEAIVYGTTRGLSAQVEWSQATLIESLLPLGEWDECLQVARELGAADDARGGSQVGVMARTWEATVRFFRGETAEPLAMLEAAVAAARKIQDPQVTVPYISSLLMWREIAGDIDGARALAAEFCELALQHPVFLAIEIHSVAQTLRRLGQVENLDALVRAAKSTGPGPQASIDYARAALAQAKGDHGQSLALLTGVIASSDARSNRFLGTVARLDAARNARHLDLAVEAAKLLAEAEQLAESMGARRWLDQIAEMRIKAHPAAASG